LFPQSRGPKKGEGPVFYPMLGEEYKEKGKEVLHSLLSSEEGGKNLRLPHSKKKEKKGGGGKKFVLLLNIFAIDRGREKNPNSIFCPYAR